MQKEAEQMNEQRRRCVKGFEKLSDEKIACRQELCESIKPLHNFAYMIFSCHPI
jgi:hypothetical protein